VLTVMIMPIARMVRAIEKARSIMSKHSKIVTVAVDTHAKQKLAHASNSVAELATALAFGSDDRFNPRKR
jgi:hypothetical protein